MADTIETLRADISALQAAFNDFKNYAKPVVDGHQQLPSFHGTPEEDAVFMNRPTAIPEFIPPEEAAAKAEAAQAAIDAAAAANAQPTK